MGHAIEEVRGRLVGWSTKILAVYSFGGVYVVRHRRCESDSVIFTVKPHLAFSKTLFILKFEIFESLI